MIIQILHVIPYYSPAYAFGGPVVVCEAIASRLARLGHSPRVWTSNIASPDGRKLQGGTRTEDGVTVSRYGYGFRGILRWTSLLVTPMMGVHAFTSAYAPRLVHVHEFRSYQAACAYALARRQHTPLILQPHGTIQIMLGKVRMKKLYDTIVGDDILDSAASIVALSEQEARDCQAHGVSKSRISIIPNGVEVPPQPILNARGAFRRPHGIAADDYLVLYLGRLRESKGILTLLNAFETVTLRHPKSVLALCGPDLGVAEKVREIARERNLRVIMPGTVTGEAKVAALVDSDVFCLPSPVETQSVALLEAASFALPLVAAAHCVPREFVEEGAGRFVKLDQPSIADALEELALSREVRKNLGEKARAIVQEHFQLDVMVDRVVNLYETIAGVGQ